VGFVASRSGDAQRGPLVWMRPDDALIRLLSEGELVRVISPRRQELAVLAIDDSLARGCVVVRDVLGVAVSEIVRIVKPDFDAPEGPVRQA
jgi:anaerobic selenocysteine-containing dehydrogenase